jgi:hypothetical protein
MSKKKRYETEEEIQAEIERCKRAVFALAEAESKEAEIKEGKEYIAKFGDSKKQVESERVNWLIANIPTWRLEFKKLTKRASNYENRVNTVLKDLLLTRCRTKLFSDY